MNKKEFEIDGKKYECAVLSPRQALNFQKKSRQIALTLEKMQRDGASEIELKAYSSEEQMELMMAIAFQSFLRANPHTKKEDFEEMGDLQTVMLISTYALVGEIEEKKESGDQPSE